ncbi:MAG TPA: monovalent cation/H(+) antiporter subunit G [Candidatus Acidoferrales bacterium]|nr:monovalent cation/H(+) antiporter subunit G [Candidatus Acidoferrales bacterium]
MTPRDIAAASLLVVAIIGFAVAAAGMFVSRNAYNRMHAAGVANFTTTVGVVAAIVIEKSWSAAGIKAAMIGLVFLIGGPIVSHVVARSAHAKDS